MKQNTTTEAQDDDYTEEELESIIEFWEQKSTEAAKKGDDWGRQSADKKMREAQNALDELRNENDDNDQETFVDDDGNEFTKEELETIHENIEQKTRKAAKEGDDWGLSMLREKRTKVENALDTLEA